MQRFSELFLKFQGLSPLLAGWSAKPYVNNENSYGNIISILSWTINDRVFVYTKRFVTIHGFTLSITFRDNHFALKRFGLAPVYEVTVYETKRLTKTVRDVYFVVLMPQKAYR